MLGIDIVHIERIKNIYDKFGDSFLYKIFDREEISYIKNKNYNIETISGLFAAKEALSKANGTGISTISFHDIKIKHKGSLPYGIIKNKVFDLSISHERDYAIAVSQYVYDTDDAVSDSSIKVLNRRSKNTHKGDYGKVAIVAGQKGMTGSAYLASNAALRTGSGLVYNIVPEDIMDIMSIKYIEVIAKSFKSYNELKSFTEKLDAVAIGPGIGLDSEKVNLLKNVMGIQKNMVIDADGLTILSKNMIFLKERNKFSTILTPHNAEFSRLSGYSIKETEDNRIEFAKEFAREYSCILLLKGNNTIVTDGNRVYINRSGNPGMATAGSGDVLTGIITSLLGRGIDTYEAACAGSYLHGRAGDRASKILGEEALIASDIVNNINRVIFELYKD